MLFLTFLYVFNFNIIKGVSLTESAFLVAFFLVFKYLVDSNYRCEVSNILKSKISKLIFTFMFSITFLSIIWPVIHGTFDFSFTSVLLHQWVDLEIGLLLIALFQCKKKPIIKTLIDCFFCQSIIQIMCFFSSEFTRLTDIFRSDSLILQRTGNYLGYRGLAISGSNFFGLAVVYAIVFIVLAFYWEFWDKLIYFKILYVVCMVFGAVSSGRTSVVGIIIFAVVMIIKTLRRIKNPKILMNVIGVCASLFLIFIVANYLFEDRISTFFSENAAWQRFSFYLFQFLQDDGSTNFGNVTSLNHLLNDMYFELSPSQVTFGDGFYTGTDGAYYMHTDVGYMRNLLFGGLLITFVLYFYQYKLIMVNINSHQQKYFAYILMVSLAIFEAKGQTMGFLIISQCLILLIVCDLDSLIPITQISEQTINTVSYAHSKNKRFYHIGK